MGRSYESTAKIADEINTSRINRDKNDHTDLSFLSVLPDDSWLRFSE
jgi:hypothetical protein